MVQELVLGTAQWGYGYGVTNVHYRLDDPTIAGIMTIANERGIDAVDTAAGYGDALIRLRPWASQLRITTKVKGAQGADIATELKTSLAELGIDSVAACLVHDWHVLSADERATTARAMEELRDRGLVQAVGISGYDEGDLATALESFTRLDVVQVPANVLDRRLEASAVRQELSARGMRIQVRSVFLQGLLLGAAQVPMGSHPAVRAFFDDCAARGMTTLVAALAHVRALDWVDEVVLGVTSPAELVEILDVWAAGTAQLAPVELACTDLGLIDPRTWVAA